jgi:hypothetical protein
MTNTSKKEKGFKTLCSISFLKTFSYFLVTHSKKNLLSSVEGFIEPGFTTQMMDIVEMAVHRVICQKSEILWK